MKGVLDYLMTSAWRQLLAVLVPAVTCAPAAHAGPPQGPPALFEEGARVESPQYEVEIMTSPDASIANLDLIEKAGGSMIPHGDVIFASMGGRTVAIIDATDPDLPLIVAKIGVQSNVLDMVVDGETLVITLRGNEILTYGIGNPRSPVLLESLVLPGVARCPGIRTTVVEVEEGYAVLDAGEADGIEVGMKFAIVVDGERPRAIVVIERTTEHRSWGKLPLRGSAAAGDPAYETEQEWGPKYWMLPDPEPGHFLVAFDFMPIIGVSRGRDTWGFLSDLLLLYRFGIGLELGAVLAPGGFAHSDDGNGGVFELGLVLGYSSRYLGYRIGAGAHLSGSYGKDKGLWLNRLRFGCEEGVNLTVDLSWVIPSVHDDAQMILPSTLVLMLNVPVHRRLVVYGVAGGGNPAMGARNSRQSGWARLLMGLKALVRGTSGRGTLFVSAAMGYGYVWDHSPFDVNPEEGGFTAGILVHLGVETRF